MNAPTPDRYRWSYKGVTFDFYRLCEILGITHHAQAHALKKVIRAGRSIKPVTQDIDETIAALQRWKEMIGEDILSSSNSMAEAMATQYSGSEPVAGEPHLCGSISPGGIMACDQHAGHQGPHLHEVSGRCGCGCGYKGMWKNTTEGPTSAASDSSCPSCKGHGQDPNCPQCF